MVGRSPYMQPVHTEAPEESLGALVALRIAAGYANSLSGHVVDRAGPPMNAGNPA